MDGWSSESLWQTTIDALKADWVLKCSNTDDLQETPSLARSLAPVPIQAIHTHLLLLLPVRRPRPRPRRSIALYYATKV